MAQPQPLPPRFTYGDYLQWADGHRWELYEGEAKRMFPGPGLRHQTVLAELARQASNFLEEHRCRVLFAPFDVRFPVSDEVDEEITTVLQPDLLVVCDPTKLDERGCRGAPDWIVEILSPSTRGDDLVRKRGLYERHGVRELWLLDPGTKTLHRLVREGDGGFVEAVEPASGRTAVGVLPGFAIDWSRVFR